VSYGRSLFLLTAGLLYGDLIVNVPVAGYVTGSNRAELRAVYGVPGSYRFSQPISLPKGVSRIHPAPEQDFALAELGDAGLGALWLSGGAVDRLVVVQGTLPTADWVAFSPSGSSSVLFSSSANRLQIVTGLPDAPSVAMDLDAAILPETPRIAAVSDDGKAILVASATAVYLVPLGGSAQLVLSVGELGSVVFLRNRMDAVVSDRGAGSIHLLQNLNTAPTERVVATGLDGVGRIYPSWDGAAVFVARRGAMEVSSVDLVSGELRSFPSAVAPVELIPLRNRDTFLISAKPGEPGWIFFRDGSLGRAVAVPTAKDLTENLQ
jgi:hypothetical protein